MSWKKILLNNITSIAELSKIIDLPLTDFGLPINIPLRLVNKIERGNNQDPILKQFIPQSSELHHDVDFSNDPLNEIEARFTTKGLKKYDGRFLIITTGCCAMKCRFCFRKKFEYGKGSGFEEELEYIRSDNSLYEVILSGGDPLALSDKVLQNLLLNLEEIGHIKRVRIHTRFPIGIPERISTSLLNILSKCKLQIWFVIHCNHPNELDEDIFLALRKLQKAGVPILHQAVLLKDINDSVSTLYKLFQLLVNHGIHPYYLHQLDRVDGSKHFEVNRDEGLRLVAELRKKLSGYAVPHYVQEISGELAKSIIF